MTAPIRVFCGAIALLLLTFSASAQSPISADEAESIVRARWYEGVPPERIAALSDAAVERIGDLLDDPAEQEYHAAAIALLGQGGGTGAYEAILDFASLAPQGDVDGAVLRARLEVPLALGRLANSDDRALAWLLDAASQSSPVEWHSGRIDAARIGRMLQRYAITGLALSGRAEARDALLAHTAAAGAFSSSPADAAFSAHVSEALQVHAARAGEGGGR
jgi:hypothetical protein